MKKIITIASIILSHLVNAQTKSFVIETDPLPYFFKGYSAEAAYSFNRNRIYLEVVKLSEIPSFILSNKNFTEERFVIGIGYSRFLKSDQKGLFVGGDLSNSYSIFKLKNSDLKLKNETFKIGIRIGYTFYPIKKIPNLLVSPWISPRIATNISNINLGSEVLTRGLIDVVGAVHIGYKFTLNKK
jgi:hypothetical protein